MSILYFLPDEIEHLQYLVSSITVSPSECPELYCKQTKHLSQFIYPQLQEQLQHFAKHGSPATGYILFTGLPLPHIPPTPPNNTHHIGETTNIAYIQSLFLQSISELVAYEA